MAALKEAIMTAQSANDNVCLQHALTWMYKLTKPTNKKTLIEHSVIKSMEMNLTYVTSLGIQSYTQHAGLSGGNPKQIFEVRNLNITGTSKISLFSICKYCLVYKKCTGKYMYICTVNVSL